MPQPAPPPEAALIRLVRSAAKISIAEAAARADMSKARWIQIEQGYETRKGERHPAWAPPGTLAFMAAALGISPERLETEGRRPDAAAVLREKIRQETQQQETPADDRPPIVKANWHDPDVRTIWALDQFSTETRENIVRVVLRHTGGEADDAAEPARRGA